MSYCNATNKDAQAAARLHRIERIHRYEAEMHKNQAKVCLCIGHWAKAVYHTQVALHLHLMERTQ